MRVWLIFFAVNILSGCALDRSGTNGTEPLDSALSDDGSPDVEDSSVIDTGQPDTAVVIDTADTKEAEVVEDVPALPPLLEATVVPVAPDALAVDLTAVGTETWGHWGLTDASSFTRKAAVGGIDKLTIFPGAIRWPDYPFSFSWSDGDPVKVMPATRTGLLLEAKDGYFQVDIIAGTAARTVRLYLSTFSQATLIASLSDKSTADAIVTWPTAAVLTGANVPCVAVIKARAAAPSAKLRVTLLKTAPGFSMSLHSATVH